MDPSKTRECVRRTVSHRHRTRFRPGSISQRDVSTARLFSATRAKDALRRRPADSPRFSRTTLGCEPDSTIRRRSLTGDNAFGGVPRSFVSRHRSARSSRLRQSLFCGRPRYEKKNRYRFQSRTRVDRSWPASHRVRGETRARQNTTDHERRVSPGRRTRVLAEPFRSVGDTRGRVMSAELPTDVLRTFRVFAGANGVIVGDAARRHREKRSEPTRKMGLAQTVKTGKSRRRVNRFWPVPVLRASGRARYGPAVTSYVSRTHVRVYACAHRRVEYTTGGAIRSGQVRRTGGGGPGTNLHCQRNGRARACARKNTRHTLTAPESPNQ